MSQPPAKKPNEITKFQAIKNELTVIRDRLAEVAPKYMSIDRLTRLMLAAVSKSPKILECTPDSILAFCMKCAETGLEPIGAGGCWPIPYKTTLTFIPDYRGLVHCAVRAGCITSAFAEIVREADEFDYELGLEPKLTHRPARGDRGDLEAAYCVFQLPDGTKHFTVMDRQEIIGIRRRSKAADGGPWVTDESEMWKKTVIRRAMKPFAGMSSQLDAAIDADDESNGVVKKDPVPMPRAIGEEPEPTPEPEAKPITKVQTKRINELLALLDMPPDDVEAILGADVAALTEAQADDVLAKLRKIQGEREPGAEG